MVFMMNQIYFVLIETIHMTQNAFAQVIVIQMSDKCLRTHDSPTTGAMYRRTMDPFEMLSVGDMMNGSETWYPWELLTSHETIV